MIKEQECKYCFKVKSADMFNIAPRNTNGLNRKCKQCMADDHRAKHPVDPPPVDLEGEEWRKVEGYEEYYEVSNKGRIKSYKQGFISLIKPSINSRGYAIISLCDGFDNSKRRKLHRIVGTAFIPNPKNLPQINHMDGVKHNNLLENLEWCDNSRNQRHAFDMGLIKPKRGSINGMSKITDDIVIKIRLEHPIKSQKLLSLEYGVSQSTISSILRRKTWFHI